MSQLARPIAFANAAAGGDAATAKEVLSASLAFFEDSGYGTTNMAQDLRGWLGRL